MEYLNVSTFNVCFMLRSLLQLIFLPTSRPRMFGSAQLLDVMRDTLRKFSAPLSLMPGSPIYVSAQVKECMDVFLSQASRPLISIFQVGSCHKLFDHSQSKSMFQMTWCSHIYRPSYFWSLGAGVLRIPHHYTANSVSISVSDENSSVKKMMLQVMSAIQANEKVDQTEGLYNNC